MQEGQWVWVPDETEAFRAAKVTGRKHTSIVLKTLTGEQIVVEEAEIEKYHRLEYDELNESPDDLVLLASVSEPLILHTLRGRFERDVIYTNIGTILISINPFKRLPGLYATDTMDKYMQPGVQLEKESPHVYAVACAAYRAMAEDKTNSSVLISGESGAGKTEATKLCLQYFVAVSNTQMKSKLKSNSNVSNAGRPDIERAILQANPVLEAFGNSRTLRNNNSSRFGKWVEILFDSQACIKGSRTVNYLLEKSRISAVPKGERNFHVFYQLVAGIQGKERDTLQLQQAQGYAYLSRGDCVSIENVDDGADLSVTTEALKALGVSPSERTSLFRVLAGILHLGNIALLKDSSDKTSEGSRVGNKETLQLAANLLGFQEADLEKAITSRKIMGSTFAKLAPEAACDARDTLAKHIYGRMFDWIVERINKATSPPKNSGGDSLLIGVLDIFGFEIFEDNGFEQLCINFANERLQQHFTTHTFLKEQSLYRSEGIECPNITYIDNQPVLDLVDGKAPPGILTMIDDEIRVPKGCDNTLYAKLTGPEFLKQHTCLRRANKGRSSNSLSFLIQHYAGDVVYNAQGWLLKNKDALGEGLLSLVLDSEETIVRESFHQQSARLSVAPGVLRASSSGGRRGARKSTQGTAFSQQLSGLMATLNNTQPCYIRCVKSNSQKSPNIFDPKLIYHQLSCSGVFEAVIIRKSGFPFVNTHSDFMRMYICLLSEEHRVRIKALTPSAKCKEIIDCALETNEFPASNLQLGRTRVLYRPVAHRYLRAQRIKAEARATRVVQSAWRLVCAARVAKQLRRKRDSLRSAMEKKDLNSLSAALKSAKEATLGFCRGRAQKFFVRVPEEAEALHSQLKEEQRIEIELSKYINASGMITVVLEENDSAFDALRDVTESIAKLSSELGRPVPKGRESIVSSVQKALLAAEPLVQCRRDLEHAVSSGNEALLQSTITTSARFLETYHPEDSRKASCRERCERLMREAKSALDHVAQIKETLSRAVATNREAEMARALEEALSNGLSCDDPLMRQASETVAKFDDCRARLRLGVMLHDGPMLETALRNVSSLGKFERPGDETMIRDAKREADKQKKNAILEKSLRDVLCEANGRSVRTGKSEWDHSRLSVKKLRETVEQAERAEDFSSPTALALLLVAHRVISFRELLLASDWSRLLELVDTWMSDDSELLSTEAELGSQSPVPGRRASVVSSRFSTDDANIQSLKRKRAHEANVDSRRVISEELESARVEASIRSQQEKVERRLRLCLESRDDEGLAAAVVEAVDAGISSNLPGPMQDATQRVAWLKTIETRLDVACRSGCEETLTDVIEDAVKGGYSSVQTALDLRDRFRKVRDVLRRATVRKDATALRSALGESTTLGIVTGDVVVKEAESVLLWVEGTEARLRDAMVSADVSQLREVTLECDSEEYYSHSVAEAKQMKENLESAIDALEAVDLNDIDDMTRVLRMASESPLADTHAAVRKVESRLARVKDVDAMLREAMGECLVDEKRVAVGKLREGLRQAEEAQVNSIVVTRASILLTRANELEETALQAINAFDANGMDSCLRAANQLCLQPQEQWIVSTNGRLEWLRQWETTSQSAEDAKDVGKLNAVLAAAAQYNMKSPRVDFLQSLREELEEVYNCLRDASNESREHVIKSAIEKAKSIGMLPTDPLLLIVMERHATIQSLQERAHVAIQISNISQLQDVAAEAASLGIYSSSFGSARHKENSGQDGAEWMARVSERLEQLLSCEKCIGDAVNNQDEGAIEAALSKARAMGIDTDATFEEDCDRGSIQHVIVFGRKRLLWLRETRAQLLAAKESGVLSSLLKAVDAAKSGGLRSDDLKIVQETADSWKNLEETMKAATAAKDMQKLSDALDECDVVGYNICDENAVGRQASDMLCWMRAVEEKAERATASKDIEAIRLLLDEARDRSFSSPNITTAEETLNKIERILESIQRALTERNLMELEIFIAQAKSFEIPLDREDVKCAIEWATGCRELLSRASNALSTAEPESLQRVLLRSGEIGFECDTIATVRMKHKTLCGCARALSDAVKSKCIQRIREALDTAVSEGLPMDHLDFENARETLENLVRASDMINSAISSVCVDGLRDALAEADKFGLQCEPVDHCRALLKEALSVIATLRSGILKRDESVITSALSAADIMGLRDSCDDAADTCVTEAESHPLDEICRDDVNSIFPKGRDLARGRATLTWLRSFRNQLLDAMKSMSLSSLEAVVSEGCANGLGETTDVCAASSLLEKIRRSSEEFSVAVRDCDEGKLRAALATATSLGLPDSLPMVQNASVLVESMKSLRQKITESSDPLDISSLRKHIAEAEAMGLMPLDVVHGKKLISECESIENLLTEATDTRDEAKLVTAIRRAEEAGFGSGGQSEQDLLQTARQWHEWVSGMNTDAANYTVTKDLEGMRTCVIQARQNNLRSDVMARCEEVIEKMDAALRALEDACQSQQLDALRKAVTLATDTSLRENNPTFVRARAMLSSLEDCSSCLMKALESSSIADLDTAVRHAARVPMAPFVTADDAGAVADVVENTVFSGPELDQAKERLAELKQVEHQLVFSLDTCNVASIETALTAAKTVGIPDSDPTVLVAQTTLESLRGLLAGVERLLEEEECRIAPLQAAVSAAVDRGLRSGALDCASQRLDSMIACTRAVNHAAEETDMLRLTRALEDAEELKLCPEEDALVSGRAVLEWMQNTCAEAEEAMASWSVTRIRKVIAEADARGFRCDVILQAQELFSSLSECERELTDATLNKDEPVLRAWIARAEAIGVPSSLPFFAEALRVQHTLNDLQERVHSAIVSQDARALRWCVDDGTRAGLGTCACVRRASDALMQLESVCGELRATSAQKDIEGISTAIAKATSLGLPAANPDVQHAERSRQWVEQLEKQCVAAVTNVDITGLVRVLTEAEAGKYTSRSIDRAREVHAQAVDCVKCLDQAVVARDMSQVTAWLSQATALGISEEHPAMQMATVLHEKAYQLSARLDAAMKACESDKLTAAIDEAAQTQLTSSLPQLDRAVELRDQIVLLLRNLRQCTERMDETGLVEHITKAEILKLPYENPIFVRARETLQWMGDVNERARLAVEDKNEEELSRVLNDAKIHRYASDQLQSAREVMSAISECLRDLEQAVKQVDTIGLTKALERATQLRLPVGHPRIAAGRQALEFAKKIETRLREAIASRRVEDLSRVLSESQSCAVDKQLYEECEALYAEVIGALADLRKALRLPLVSSAETDLVHDVFSKMAPAVPEDSSGASNFQDRLNEYMRRRRDGNSNLINVAFLTRALERAKASRLQPCVEMELAEHVITQTSELAMQAHVALENGDVGHLSSVLSDAAALGVTGGNLEHLLRDAEGVIEALRGVQEAAGTFDEGALQASIRKATEAGVTEDHYDVRRALEQLELVRDTHLRLNQALACGSRAKLAEVISDTRHAGYEFHELDDAQEVLKEFSDVLLRLGTALRDRDEAGLRLWLTKAKDLRISAEEELVVSHAEAALEWIILVKKKLSSSCQRARAILSSASINRRSSLLQDSNQNLSPAASLATPRSSVSPGVQTVAGENGGNLALKGSQDRGGKKETSDPLPHPAEAVGVYEELTEWIFTAISGGLHATEVREATLLRNGLSSIVPSMRPLISSTDEDGGGTVFSQMAKYSAMTLFTYLLADVETPILLYPSFAAFITRKENRDSNAVRRPRSPQKMSMSPLPSSPHRGTSPLRHLSPSRRSNTPPRAGTQAHARLQSHTHNAHIPNGVEVVSGHVWPLPWLVAALEEIMDECLVLLEEENGLHGKGTATTSESILFTCAIRCFERTVRNVRVAEQQLGVNEASGARPDIMFSSPRGQAPLRGSAKESSLTTPLSPVTGTPQQRAPRVNKQTVRRAASSWCADLLASVRYHQQAFRVQVFDRFLRNKLQPSDLRFFLVTRSIVLNYVCKKRIQPSHRLSLFPPPPPHRNSTMPFPIDESAPTPPTSTGSANRQSFDANAHTGGAGAAGHGVSVVSPGTTKATTTVSGSGMMLTTPAARRASGAKSAVSGLGIVNARGLRSASADWFDGLVPLSGIDPIASDVFDRDAASSFANHVKMVVELSRKETVEVYELILLAVIHNRTLRQSKRGPHSSFAQDGRGAWEDTLDLHAAIRAASVTAPAIPTNPPSCYQPQAEDFIPIGGVSSALRHEASGSAIDTADCHERSKSSQSTPPCQQHQTPPRYPSPNPCTPYSPASDASTLVRSPPSSKPLENGTPVDGALSPGDPPNPLDSQHPSVECESQQSDPHRRHAGHLVVRLPEEDFTADTTTTSQRPSPPPGTPPATVVTSTVTGPRHAPVRYEGGPRISHAMFGEPVDVADEPVHHTSTSDTLSSPLPSVEEVLPVGPSVTLSQPHCISMANPCDSLHSVKNDVGDSDVTAVEKMVKSVTTGPQSRSHARSVLVNSGAIPIPEHEGCLSASSPPDISSVQGVREPAPALAPAREDTLSSVEQIGFGRRSSPDNPTTSPSVHPASVTVDAPSVAEDSIDTVAAGRDGDIVPVARNDNNLTKQSQSPERQAVGGVPTLETGIEGAEFAGTDGLDTSPNPVTMYDSVATGNAVLLVKDHMKEVGVLMDSDASSDDSDETVLVED